MGKKIILATRKSPLALKQAELTFEFLSQVLPDCEIEIKKMVTTGDRQTSWSLEKEGGKGLFTKELEDALLSGEADIAVHSAKDMPTDMPEGLALAGFLPKREQVNDVLVCQESVKEPVFIATGSPRRRAQAKVLYPKAVWSEIRGNVDTRLKKIAIGKAEATIIAAAGLNRLGITEWPGLTFKPFDISQMVPAVGQGAVALQTRADRVPEFYDLFDRDICNAVEIERNFLGKLGGGCQTAFGAHFCEGTLHVFHEDIGVKTYPINDVEKADACIEKIVEEIQSKQV